MRDAWPPLIREMIRDHPEVDVVTKAFPAGFPHDAPFVAVAGWMRDEAGNVLLVRHHEGTPWGGAWATPGGLVRESESPEEAVRREVLEETGVDVRDVSLRRVVVMEDRSQEPPRTSFTLIFATRAGSTPPGRPQADDAVLEARWFRKLPEDMAFREEYEDLL